MSLPNWNDALRLVIHAGVQKVIDEASKENATAYENTYKSIAGDKFDESVKSTIAKNVADWAEVSRDSVVKTLSSEIENAIQEAYDSGTSTQELSRILDGLVDDVAKSLRGLKSQKLSTRANMKRTKRTGQNLNNLYTKTTGNLHVKITNGLTMKGLSRLMSRGLRSTAK
jgi:hypothetical protein